MLQLILSAMNGQLLPLMDMSEYLGIQPRRLQQSQSQEMVVEVEDLQLKVKRL